MLLVDFTDKLVHKLLVSVEFLQQSSQPSVIDVQRWPANESHTSHMVFNTNFSYLCCSSAPSSLFSPTQGAQKIRYHLLTVQPGLSNWAQKIRYHLLTAQPGLSNWAQKIRYHLQTAQPGLSNWAQKIRYHLQTAQLGLSNWAKKIWYHLQTAQGCQRFQQSRQQWAKKTCFMYRQDYCFF